MRFAHDTHCTHCIYTQTNDPSICPYSLGHGQSPLYEVEDIDGLCLGIGMLQGHRQPQRELHPPNIRREISHWSLPDQ